jgi:hypothetical protein
MRVFVSSTYRDLIEHRRAVADALERLGLHFKRMETFGARPEDATLASLGEVESSELFVGIYAHRYGYVAPNSQISITEEEFNCAFNNRRPTFCFFVDEGFEWAPDLIENEPGASLLKSFKARVEQLVVRDYFTTPDVLASRVSSSIGRYLLADPRRHGAPSASEFARLTLADISAMAFVDVMRLACVAGSELARAVNQSRYTEFVDVADLHLSEFRTQVTRLSDDSDLDVITKCAEVERGLAWAILRLRREPKLDRSWREFIGSMRGLAERINALAEVVSGDYYAKRIKEVASVSEKVMQRLTGAPLTDNPDEFVRLRFSAQSDVIDQMQKIGGFAIATIRDDIDRRLAIPYFRLDLMLLRNAEKLAFIR